LFQAPDQKQRTILKLSGGVSFVKATCPRRHGLPGARLGGPQRLGASWHPAGEMPALRKTLALKNAVA